MGERIFIWSRFQTAFEQIPPQILVSYSPAKLGLWDSKTETGTRVIQEIRMVGDLQGQKRGETSVGDTIRADVLSAPVVNLIHHCAICNKFGHGAHICHKVNGTDSSGISNNHHNHGGGGHNGGMGDG